jgi:CMP-N,N'-diacetyllegionaminic acid synthase
VPSAGEVVLGLIPARGGSKGIPGKNLVPLAGKPLLAWTVEAARAARSLTRVVVSTDDDGIAATAGVEVLRRPAELAADETPMLDVIRHAAEEIPCDLLVLLQPTSPLRRPDHIDEAVALLRETGADCVVSVVEVPHQFRPESLMAVEDGRLVALGDARRRQDKQPVYARNGPAVLVVRPERLGDDLYEGDTRAYVMAPRDSIDVDGPFELQLAELLLAHR